MSFSSVSGSSLTPSRPAPAAPLKRGDIQNVLANSGYGSSFSVGSSSTSSYASYTGIGGSPNRSSDGIMGSHIVRSGLISVKEDGLVSWLWRPKWLILKEQTLSIHKNEVSTFRCYVSFWLWVGMRMLRLMFSCWVHAFGISALGRVRVAKGDSAQAYSQSSSVPPASYPLSSAVDSCRWPERRMWWLSSSGSLLVHLGSWRWQDT